MKTSIGIVAIAGVGVLSLVQPLAARDGVEHFTAFAINTNNGGASTTIDFTVSRWSSDAERERLRSILQENTHLGRQEQRHRARELRPAAGHAHEGPED